MQRLILFDVDLTLVATAGCNLLALNSAFEQVHGIPDAFNDVFFGGGLDLPLMKAMYEKYDLTKGDSFEVQELADFKEEYFDQLARRLETWTEGYMCRGAKELLEALAREPRVQLGLETGNFRESAFIKLRRFGLDVFFGEGGFGGDRMTRREVVADAIDKCQEQSEKRYERSEIFVVGDSVTDVEAGRANGVNTVGVATGHYDVEALKASGATYVLEDLSDTKGVLEVLLGAKTGRASGHGLFGTP